MPTLRVSPVNLAALKSPIFRHLLRSLAMPDQFKGLISSGVKTSILA